MKEYLICFLIFIFSIGIVFADAEKFAEAKKIIDAETPCSALSETQLEALGDYLMEQMHPGEAHETMDKMMGGEGSESLRFMHISMAQRLYCNDVGSAANYGMMGYGMMNTLGKIDYGGMRNMMAYNFGYGMMGQSYGYWGLINFLYVALVIGLVILVYLWIAKLWKEIFKKGK